MELAYGAGLAGCLLALALALAAYTRLVIQPLLRAYA